MNPQTGAFQYCDQLFVTITAAVLQRDIVLVNTNPGGWSIGNNLIFVSLNCNSFQWRNRYQVFRAGGDTAGLQETDPLYFSFTGEGAHWQDVSLTRTHIPTHPLSCYSCLVLTLLSQGAHYSSLEPTEDSRLLRHVRGEDVSLHSVSHPRLANIRTQSEPRYRLAQSIKC